jgi:hypothetical protein
MASRGAGPTDWQEALETAVPGIELSIDLSRYSVHICARLSQLLCFADAGPCVHKRPMCLPCCPYGAFENGKGRDGECPSTNRTASNVRNSGMGYDLSYPHNRPWRPIGLWHVKDPTLSRQSAHTRRWDSQPYAPAALYSPKHYFPVSGTHFCSRLSEHKGLVRPKGLDKLKKVTSSGLELATFRLVA